MKGLRGLSYLKYQEDRLKQFLKKNTGMKILIHVDALSKDGDTITFKPRRYEVLNTDGITDVMTKMGMDIETQIENAPLSKPIIVIEKIIKILQLIMMNIIQQGLVVMLNYQSGYH